MLLYSGTTPGVWDADTMIVGVFEYDFPKLTSYKKNQFCNFFFIIREMDVKCTVSRLFEM